MLKATLKNLKPNDAIKKLDALQLACYAALFVWALIAGSLIAVGIAIGASMILVSHYIVAAYGEAVLDRHQIYIGPKESDHV